MTRTEIEPRQERPSSAVLADWMRALDNTQRRQGAETSLLSVVGEVSARGGDRPALIGRDETLSYSALVDRANRYARWGLKHGLRTGDVVALLMDNRPDYVAIWLGLTHIGCAVALLNTHLGAEALVHGIRAAGARNVIAAAPLADLARRAAVQSLWLRGDGGDFDRAIAAMEGVPVAIDPPPQRQRALLIYTSGTTGLPKAANVSHGRILGWSDWFAGLMDASENDRLYDCLPMYHSVGGVVAIGSMLVSGGSVVIRERFSAQRFWDDVAATECTVVQYIGELCRYLTQAPPSAGDTAHRVRLFCGNGLRGDVWPVLQARFGIPRILEFYAATEGSVSLYNCEGRVGAIGRVPPFLAHRFPLALIRCDAETGEPIRGDDGLCIRCATGEVGEGVGRLDDADGATLRRFDGYTDRAASERKVLSDVFAPGDRWFRTGDLMRKDGRGYYYFVDRLGDTFRWKGENVSTTEVAMVLGACNGVKDVVVYGVDVPGAEGKAGMAAVVAGDGFDLAVLHAHVHDKLPGYAAPLFVRLCGAIEATGTFKLTKTALVRDGYRGAGGDPVWFDDRAGYVPCDADLLRRLDERTLKL